MSYLAISGRKIYYEEYGTDKAPTLIYLHGGPGESCLTYTYQARKLGETFHVISFDQYGVFRSDAVGDESLGVNDLVQMTEQMRIALGIESWIPLGHSFGGMLALVYAHTYPDSIDAVIYDCPMWSALHTARAIAEATLPCFEQEGIAEQTALCRRILNSELSSREAFEKAMSIDMNESVQRYCHVIENDRYNDYINTHIPDPMVTEDCWGKFADFRKKLFLSEDFYADYIPYLADIAKPQLLIVGEYDMTCGRYEQKWFADNAPDGKTEILSGCAHLTWFEQPEKYTDIIVKMFSNHK